MCSIFGPRIMDNYQGDLTDIIKASGGGAYGGTSSSSSSHHQQQHQWPSSSHDPINFPNFGDPFSTTRDPFLQELNMPSYSVTINNNHFNSSSGGLLEEAAAAGFCGNNSTSTIFGHGKNNIEDDHHHMTSSKPCKNIFSNMIQISPNAIKPSSAPPNSSSSSKDNNSLLDSTQLQISSSPRNPSLKRRKNQAKKVVCIPAPAAANSRQSGEVVPSDLWAWRKYGQKPIKGSPYPRGYYRCSSSKGCSARKQVERSRTDPNMLVITYTCEHNHPWPTQRNALAGSTRSQPSSINKNNSNSSESQKGNTTNITTTKEEQDHHEIISNNTTNNNINVGVKEELEIEEQVHDFSDGGATGLPYRPSTEDFFADLGEIEADPLELLFTDHHQRESKAASLDPFHLFDWSAAGDTTNNTSFEELLPPHHNPK